MQQRELTFGAFLKATLIGVVAFLSAGVTALLLVYEFSRLLEWLPPWAFASVMYVGFIFIGLAALYAAIIAIRES